MEPKERTFNSTLFCKGDTELVSVLGTNKMYTYIYTSEV